MNNFHSLYLVSVPHHNRHQSRCHARLRTKYRQSREVVVMCYVYTRGGFKNVPLGGALSPFSCPVYTKNQLDVHRQPPQSPLHLLE